MVEGAFVDCALTSGVVPCCSSGLNPATDRCIRSANWRDGCRQLVRRGRGRRACVDRNPLPLMRVLLAPPEHDAKPLLSVDGPRRSVCVRGNGLGRATSCLAAPQSLTGGHRPLDERAELGPHDPGCTRGAQALNVPNPQSGAAMTFSRPTILAYWTMRCATRSGCSTNVVTESMTPGMRILPSGSLTFSQTSHSWAWRGFAASIEYAWAYTVTTRSTMWASGTSSACGASVLPQHT